MSVRRGLLAAGLLAAVLLSPGPLRAQGSSECPDQLRTLQVLAEQYARGRQRAEFDAAQTIAALQKRIEQLTAELAEAKKKTLPAGQKEDAAK